MAKQKKKRNKVYKGNDAAIRTPAVTRIEAVNRSRPKQWWVDHKRIAKPALIAGGVVLIVVILLFEAIRLIAGL